MPTICDIKIQLREKGIKGTTGLNKGQLMELLKTGKKPVKLPRASATQSTVPYQGEPDVPFQEKIKIKVKKKKPSPVKEDFKAISAVPLSNKSLVELYKMNLSLEKIINDSVNVSEAEHSKRVLVKVRKAFKHNRAKFMEKIEKSSNAELLKMKQNLSKIYSSSKDEDEKKVIGGQIAEITKLIKAV